MDVRKQSLKRMIWARVGLGRPQRLSGVLRLRLGSEVLEQGIGDSDDCGKKVLGARIKKKKKVGFERK